MRVGRDGGDRREGGRDAEVRGFSRARRTISSSVSGGGDGALVDGPSSRLGIAMGDVAGILGRRRSFRWNFRF